jgi:hypothetical protein
MKDAGQELQGKVGRLTVGMENAGQQLQGS